MKTLQNYAGRKGPLVLAILDGVGIGAENDGNAVHLAYTPTLDMLRRGSLYCELKAHGKAVGLPSDKDMGNSEVGHNALGSGQIYDQGAKLVSEAISSQELFQGKTWLELIQNCQNNNTPLHFIGLVSDGNVHSHIDHLISMLKRAADAGIQKVYVHALLDGRDVAENSALVYVEQLEKTFSEIYEEKRFEYKIASGGGRMYITMDRYGADWDMVKRGWEVHVLGKGRGFQNASEAINAFRSEKRGVSDQYLPSFVIHENNEPVGKIEDQHSVVFFNFRGDRAIEISQAFTHENFEKFDRMRFPKVTFAGMMQYDGDSKTPEKFLVSPPVIQNTMGEYLAENNISQFAISETQKYGHVTYFWNGNRLGKFSEDTEIYQEILSDKDSFEHRPWMKAVEITEAIMDHLNENDTKFVRLNYPNGDMVGHTGDISATAISVATADMCLKRLFDFVKDKDGIVVVLADHGNADEMYETDKDGNFIWNEDLQKYKSKTCHTLNPVPFAIYDPSYNNEYKINKSLPDKGLSNVAATILNLMGYEAPKNWNSSLIIFE